MTRDPITVPLSGKRHKPVTVQLAGADYQAHGEPITSLTLRPARGGDFERSGYWMRHDGDGQIPDTNACGRLMVELAGVPRSTIVALSAADWLSVMQDMTPMLGEPADDQAEDDDPITANGAPITSLILRPIGGDDIMACGFPFRAGPDGEIITDAKIMARYGARLGGVPLNTIRSLTAFDWGKMSSAVEALLTPVAAEAPGEPQATA